MYPSSENTDDTLQYFCSREEGAEERDERNQAERFPDASLSLSISKLTFNRARKIQLCILPF